MKKIEEGTFSGCSKLTQISIPSSVASIEDDAFKDCLSLDAITISSSVKSIGKGLPPNTRIIWS